MTDPFLTGLLDTMADAAAAAILPHFRTPLGIDNKLADGFDPVTAADRDAELALRAILEERCPDHGIVGEEFPAVREDAEHVWVLDPVDGTRAFISGLPTWGTLIGLRRGGRAVLGMMAQAFTGERFAGDGTSAWYAGPGGARTLRARPCASLAEATLFTTSPRLFSGSELAAYDAVEGSVRLARYGVDCYAYCMVAAGFADLVIESGLKPFDIMALIPIVEGAGGIVTTWDGGSPEAGGRIVASGDGRVHEAALRRLATVL